MYDKLREKYISSVFQILKICKVFSDFDLNLTIRKKYTGFCNCLEIRSQKSFQAEYPNSIIYVLI